MKKNIITFRKYWPFCLLIPGIIITIILNAINICEESFFDFDNAWIITILLPTVFTVLSISLSLPNNKIFGISIQKIRNLRQSKFYNFQEIIWINVIIFISAMISWIFGWIVIIWTLNTIAACFVIKYWYQEIPLLSHDENKIKKIIFDSFKEIKDFSKESDLKNGENSIEHSFYSILQYLIFKENMSEVYCALKEKDNTAYNKDLINYLINMQNSFLNDMQENKSLVFDFYNGKYRDIHVSDCIGHVFDNMAFLWDESKTIGKDPVLNCVQAVVTMHELVFGTSLENVFLRRNQNLFERMFFDAYQDKTDIKNSLRSFCIRIMANNLYREDLWFVSFMNNLFIDNTRLFAHDDALEIFLTIYLFYSLKNRNFNSDDTKNIIRNILSEPCEKYKNGTCSHDEYIKRMIEFSAISLFDLLPTLLNIYEQDKEILQFYFSTKGIHFNKQYIINMWFALLLTNFNLCSHEESIKIFENKLEEMDANDAQLILITISQNWIREKKYIRNEEFLSYLDFFGMDYYWSDHIGDFGFYKKLMDKILFVETNECLCKDESSNLDMQEISRKIQAQIEKQVKALPIYSSSLETLDHSFTYFHAARLDLIDTIANARYFVFGDLVQRCVYNSFASKSQNIIEVNEENAIEIIQKVLNMRADYRSDESLFLITFLEKENEGLFHKYFSLKNGNVYSPYGLFWKDNAVRFCLKVTKCICRPLTSDELIDLIDNNYKVVDGLYKYESVKNEKSNIYLPKLDLKKKLYDTIRMIEIDVNYGVQIEEENVIKVKRNKK